MHMTLGLHPFIGVHCISTQTPLGLQTCLNGPICFPLHSRSNAARAPDMSLLSHIFSIAFPLKRRSGSRHVLMVPYIFHCIPAQTPLGLQTCPYCPIYFPLHSHSNATRAPDIPLGPKVWNHCIFAQMLLGLQPVHIIVLKYGTNAFPLKCRSGSRHVLIVPSIFHCIPAQTLLGIQTCPYCPIYLPLHSRSNAFYSIIFSIAFPISHWGMLPHFVRSLGVLPHFVRLLGVLLASLRCWGAPPPCSVTPFIGVQLNISIRS